MHPSRLNEGYNSYSNPSTPSTASLAGPSSYHQPSTTYSTASGSRPPFPRQRSAHTPQANPNVAVGDGSTPRASHYPQPIFDPDSPFSQPAQGRTIATPQKPAHHGRVDVEEGIVGKPWGEDALGSPWGTRSTSKVRLEDVAEGLAKKSEGLDPYLDVQDAGEPIAGIRRERGRGRNVVLDHPATSFEESQPSGVVAAAPHQPCPVSGPSRNSHHRGQSDDLHNRNRYQTSAPTTPSTYYVPSLQTIPPPPLTPSIGASLYQPPQVTSPLPGGDWGQFVNTELFEEGNSQEDIHPFPTDESMPHHRDGSISGQYHPRPRVISTSSSSSNAHAFHHPRPRPMVKAQDLEPTPHLEPHSDTSPTFSVPSRSQPGTPASFGIPDYAEHQMHPASAYSSTSSTGYQQFQSAQPYNPATLDSFNPAQMHLPPSVFNFTRVAPPPSNRVPDYRGHRRIKSIESVISDYSPHMAGHPEETIPEEYDTPYARNGKDDYALNDLVKQVHIQHAAPSRYDPNSSGTISRSSSTREPSPAYHQHPQPSVLQSHPGAYLHHSQEAQYPHPHSSAIFEPAMHGYVSQPAPPLILVPRGAPMPPGMMAVPPPAYSNGQVSMPHQYLQPHPGGPAQMPSPQQQYQQSYSQSGSVYSPVMGSETGSSLHEVSPVIPAQAPTMSSRETLASRRRSNRRGMSLSIPSGKEAQSGSPLSFSTSDLSSSHSLEASSSNLYHPYARPSTGGGGGRSAPPVDATPSSSKTSTKKPRANSVSAPSSARKQKSRVVDKSAMAGLIETLFEPLHAEKEGSESASPPDIDYETATGGKGKGKEELKFRCLVEGCDRAFPRRSAIIHHIQMHLSDKPFVCPVDGW